MEINLFKYNKKIVLFLLLMLFFALQIIAGRFLAVETFIVSVYLALNMWDWRFTFDPARLVSPVNIAWLVFFFRLYVLPATAVFAGYDVSRHSNEYSAVEVFLSYGIISIAYFSFLLGWEIHARKVKRGPISDYHISHRQILVVSLFFLVTGLISMVLYFPDIGTYLQNVYVATRLNIENAGVNKFLKLSVIFAKYTIPVGLAGILTLTNLEKRGKPARYLIVGLFVVLMLAATWNENRQTMVFPLVALLAAVSVSVIRLRFWPTLIFSGVMLYLLMLFMQIRMNNNHALPDKHLGTKQFIHLVQTYAGGPVQVAPVLLFDNPVLTIPASFVHSFPVLGSPFRDNSGVEQYNFKIYRRSGIADQVFPTSAEAMLNGGVLLLVLLFSLFGYFYSYLNTRFLGSDHSDILYRFALFSIVLLFTATILLSFQVAGQFLFYNALPLLLIICLYHLSNASSPWFSLKKLSLTSHGSA